MSYDISKTKIFLSSIKRVRPAIVEHFEPYYILESFIELYKDSKLTEDTMRNWYLKSKMFLLDSGAFTFMCNPDKKMDFDDYIDKYIKFINKYDIQYFFEMDVDNLFGYEKVLEIRNKIEQGTGKKVVPVWHKSRGKDEFIKMCDEYDYVAIGGIASREIKPSEFPLIQELCEIAHSKGCQIHGLGYLKLQQLNTDTCPFDTVDGFSWQGQRRGDRFELKNVDGKPYMFRYKDGQRHWRTVLKECYQVWTEYAKMKG